MLKVYWLIYQGDDSMLFTVFASMDVPVNVVELEEADQYYKEHLGTETFGVSGTLGMPQQLLWIEIT